MKNEKSKGPAPFLKNKYVSIINDDVLNLYASWPTPTLIISDGPYGIGGFPGDPRKPEYLSEWYEPHIKIWSEKSKPFTTVWFWNTEIGWANVHPILKKYGWNYVNCHIWNKGLSHIAGNANSKTLRKFPVVTEVCVQYVKNAKFIINSKKVQMKEWLRHEWSRSKLPFRKANDACGVKDAATRKYLTKCDLWYFPPVEAFEKMVKYANKYGDKNGKPYFSIDGKKSLSRKQWKDYRAKFYCQYGITNVWNEPPLNGKERIKNGQKSVHLNQKPLKLTRIIINASTDKSDVVWEPFGGLCTAAVACNELKRICFAAEINNDFFKLAIRRFNTHA